MGFVSRRDKIIKCNGNFAELTSAKYVARELALRGYYNKIEFRNDLYTVYTECSAITWDEIIEKFNIKKDKPTGVYYKLEQWIGSVARYNILESYKESYEDDYDSYDYDSYDYDDHGHCSILDGGYDEPSMDEWDKSGLL